jgi:hypothetical protein
MSDDRNQVLNDQEEATRLLLEGHQVGVWTALPGIVTAVDFTKMTCSVQPALKAVVLDQDGNPSAVNLPLLVDVPLVFPKGGGFLITMPIAVNDEVLVIFSSRCIDAWWQSGGVQQAMEARMHDLSDGFAIPGPYSLPSLSGMGAVSGTDLQVRNQGGTCYISVTADGKVKLVSPTEIDITAPAVNITGAVVVTGTVSCGALTCASIGTSGSGSATIGGALSAASVTSGGIGLSTHKHTGVTTGGGTSGGPTP